MEESNQLGALIEGIGSEYVNVNGKRVQIEDGKLWVTHDMLINKHVVGYNRMHKKLEMILASSKESKNVSLEKLLRFVANATLIRLAHFENLLKLPRFIAKQIFDTLVETEACVSANGALRKSKEYQAIVSDLSTKASMVKKKHWFELPPEHEAPVDTGELPMIHRSLQDLYALREQAEKHGTPEQLEIVDRHIAEKKQERKDEEREKIEAIMKERGISRERARMVLITQEEEEEQRAYDETEANKEGGDVKVGEWYSDEMESESDIEKREEKERAKRKKKKSMKKKK